MSDLKRYTKAEVALLEAHEILTATYGAGHGGVRSLAKLYDAWGKPDEAAEWRAKLSESTTDTAPDS